MPRLCAAGMKAALVVMQLHLLCMLAFYPTTRCSRQGSWHTWVCQGSDSDTLGASSAALKSDLPFDILPPPSLSPLLSCLLSVTWTLDLTPLPSTPCTFNSSIPTS